MTSLRHPTWQKGSISSMHWCQGNHISTFWAKNRHRRTKAFTLVICNGGTIRYVLNIYFSSLLHEMSSTLPRIYRSMHTAHPIMKRYKESMNESNNFLNKIIKFDDIIQPHVNQWVPCYKLTIPHWYGIHNLKYYIAY